MDEFKKRRTGYRKRKSRNLPPEKLQEILSKIYPENIAKELMDRFTERGGEK